MAENGDHQVRRYELAFLIHEHDPVGVPVIDDAHVRTDFRHKFLSKNIYVVRDGAVVPLSLDPSETEAAIESNISSLPAVRYLLPYPEEAIARSSGAYKNYYGF